MAGGWNCCACIKVRQSNTSTLQQKQMYKSSLHHNTAAQHSTEHTCLYRVPCRSFNAAQAQVIEMMRGLLGLDL